MASNYIILLYHTNIIILMNYLALEFNFSNRLELGHENI
jgi:hypothetical protein